MKGLVFLEREVVIGINIQNKDVKEQLSGEPVDRKSGSFKFCAFHLEGKSLGLYRVVHVLHVIEDAFKFNFTTLKDSNLGVYNGGVAVNGGYAAL